MQHLRGWTWGFKIETSRQSDWRYNVHRIDSRKLLSHASLRRLLEMVINQLLTFISQLHKPLVFLWDPKPEVTYIDNAFRHRKTYICVNARNLGAPHQRTHN